MDNKLIQRYAVSVVFCIFCLLAYGQNIKKHYISKAQVEGTIYHFLPVSLYADTNGEALTYDLTYTTWNDSITMNFTYVTPDPMLIDSIRYVSGETGVEGRVEKLYVEPTTKKWKHRYSLKCRADDFFQLYHSKAVPEIIIYAKGKDHRYYADKSGWHKYMPIGQKIFKMIRL